MPHPIDIASFSKGPKPVKRGQTGVSSRMRNSKDASSPVNCARSEAINEAYLISLLGLGRTHFHQALHRLERKDGQDPYRARGVMGSAPVEVRVTNEQSCVKLALERYHESDLKAMR